MNLVVFVVFTAFEADNFVTDLVDAWTEGTLLVNLGVVHLLELSLLLVLLFY